ncbi:hypothetical protein [Reichenbachiella sp. MALMAid0571]|uniref:hypothetical protein n=1 Tax=Reichenbachiella sp. MALMAid0571 TaxID=3143939 RepID=UPI0032DF41CA
MELTLEQAIKIRNDFRFIEGMNTKKGSTIQKVIVTPQYDNNFNDFLESYFKNDYLSGENEENLALTFNPRSFSVHCIMYEIQSVQLHGTLEKILDDLNISLNLEKYTS